MKATKKTKVKQPILLQVDPQVKKQFQRMAKRYMGGNVAAWIRFASQNFHPKASQLKKSA